VVCVFRRSPTRVLALTVVSALLTGVVALVVLLGPGRSVAGRPVPYCTVVRVLFDTDEQMWRVAGELRGDRRVREVRDERTKSENHDRVTAALRAEGRHDLADAARVGSTPASVRVVEAFGVDVDGFVAELRRGHRVNHVDVCDDPGAWEE
jgi:hypothetical protein